MKHSQVLSQTNKKMLFMSRDSKFKSEKHLNFGAKNVDYFYYENCYKLQIEIYSNFIEKYIKFDRMSVGNEYRKLQD